MSELNIEHVFKSQTGVIIFSQFKPKLAIVCAARQMTSYFLLNELILLVYEKNLGLCKLKV